MVTHVTIAGEILGWERFYYFYITPRLYTRRLGKSMLIIAPIMLKSELHTRVFKVDNIF